jgi:hypothetical protein
MPSSTMALGSRRKAGPRNLNSGRKWIGGEESRRFRRVASGRRWIGGAESRRVRRVVSRRRSIGGADYRRVVTGRRSRACTLTQASPHRSIVRYAHLSFWQLPGENHRQECPCNARLRWWTGDRSGCCLRPGRPHRDADQSYPTGRIDELCPIWRNHSAHS